MACCLIGWVIVITERSRGNDFAVSEKKTTSNELPTKNKNNKLSSYLLCWWINEENNTSEKSELFVRMLWSEVLWHWHEIATAAAVANNNNSNGETIAAIVVNKTSQIWVRENKNNNNNRKRSNVWPSNASIISSFCWHSRYEGGYDGVHQCVCNICDRNHEISYQW